MTLKNVFVFPALRLSGKEAGRQRSAAALSVGEAGTPRGSRQAQVGAGRARAGEAWPSLLPVWGDGSFLHQHPGTAGRAAFPPGRAKAECQLIRNSFAASWSPERAGWGGRAGNAGRGRACELSSFSR